MWKKYFPFFTALLSLAFFAGVVKAQAGSVDSPNQASEEKIYKADEVDRKAEITNRRRVKISSECGTEKNSSGQVKIELVLHKSGKVTSAELAEKSGCRYFNDRSLEIAKKIKFKPAMKDGKTVSQYAYIIYEYSFYVVN
jgi:TonB family protein